jgi:hypothetical protein
MGRPPSQASSDTNSYYYLANIVVETNQTLQNFFGRAKKGVTEPLKNVYLNGTAGSPFQMGGCQGCHGAQGQANGGDMSPVMAFAPSNSSRRGGLPAVLSRTFCSGEPTLTARLTPDPVIKITLSHIHTCKNKSAGAS